MSAEKAFKEYKKNYHIIQHEECCNKKSNYVPVDECGCDCYKKAIFKAGYDAAKGIAK